MVAQGGARQYGAGVGLDHDVVAIHLQREPLGIRDAFRAVFADLGLLAQQLGRIVHGFQPWCQGTHLGVQLGQALGFVRAVFDLRLECLGNRAQHVQKATGMVHDLCQRLQQAVRQSAARHTHACRAKPLVLPFELLAVMLHDQACQLRQVLAQSAAVAGNVGNLVHFHQLADTQCAAGQFVQPLQAAQIHVTGKLRQCSLRQMVGFIQHQQAVAQIWEQTRSQAGQQQIMVGHDHLRSHQFLAPFVVGATVKYRAMAARAGAAFCGHWAPGLGLRGIGQAVAVPVPFTLCQGISHGRIELHACLSLGLWALFALRGGFFGKQVIDFFAVFPGTGQTLQLELADKTPASLGQRKFERAGQLLRQRWQIFVDQLLLQCHGGGGNQHPCSARQRHGNRRCAIRQ